MATEDQILLKLIIQGQNPAEIERLAASTQGQLNDRMKVYLDHLTELHRQSAQAQTAEDVKRVKAAIDGAEKQIDTVAKVARAHEIANNRMQTGWRRTLEDMENITTVALGIGMAFDKIAGKAKAFGEEMLLVSQILNAPGGGQEAFAISDLVGNVNAVDIAAVRNKALQQELSLTTQDFVKLAAAAGELSDQLGIKGKEALEAFTNAIVTGRTRALTMVGVVVDFDGAYQKMAESIGKSVESLTDQEKLMARQTEVMDQVAKKAPEVGKGIETLGNAMEVSINKASNAWSAFLTTLANFKAPQFVKDLVNDDLSDEDLQGLLQTGAAEYAKTHIAARQAQVQARINAAIEKYTGGASGDELTPTNETNRFFASRLGNDFSDQKFKTTSTAAEVAKAKAAAEAQAKFNQQFEEMLLGGKGQKAYDTSQGFDASAGRTPLLDAAGFQASNTMGNEEGQRLEQGTLDTMLNQATGGGTKGQSMKEQVEKFEKDFVEPLKQKTAAYQAELDATKEKAGGGLFAVLLFGPDGPNKTYAEMDALQQATVDMSGAVADTMHKMAEAVGQSMANWVADSAGAKKSFRDTTNELLVSLSAQSYTQGLMELAKAAASAASYDYPGAEQHLIAAAAFAAVGTAAGLGARAVGHSAAAGSNSSAGNVSGKGIASRGSSSNGISSSSSSGSEAPLTINLTVLPGGEAEAGRAINKALAAFYSQTGKGVRPN